MMSASPVCFSRRLRVCVVFSFWAWYNPLQDSLMALVAGKTCFRARVFACRSDTNPTAAFETKGTEDRCTGSISSEPGV